MGWKRNIVDFKPLAVAKSRFHRQITIVLLDTDVDAESGTQVSNETLNKDVSS